MGRDVDDDDQHICHDCVGEAFLSAEIFRQGDEAECTYCGKDGQSYTLEQMADRIVGVMEEHYYRTPSEPSGFEYAMIKEGIQDWEREGEETAIAIMNLADISEQAAEDIQEILDDRHGDWEAAQMGDETDFSAEAHYAETRADTRDFEVAWSAFERSVKGEARYFGKVADRVLGDLFHDLNGLVTRSQQPVVRTIGPGLDITGLHRARVFQSETKLREALADPEQLIGTPASAYAANGRMNARGVPVFYGATTAEVALKEVRPPVGSRVVTAEFEIVRPLRVLDVEALQSIFVTGSLFDPSSGRLFNRAAFLRRLSDRIIMPVMPDDEAMDYVVTQVMAEYLAHRVDPQLDGIIYPSVQDGAGAFNVVLFNAASRVSSGPIDPGDTIEVHTSERDEDSFYPSYAIWTTRGPSREEKTRPGSPDFVEYLRAESQFRETEHDDREISLRLDRSTLKVRHIEGVTVKEQTFAVGQYELLADRPKGQGLSIVDELDI